MKEIKAIIQPFMLERVLDALAAIDDLPGLTISDVIGWGRSRALGAHKSVGEGSHAFAVKKKLEIVVGDAIAERVAETIVKAAHTGQPGDGKLFVYDLGEAIRIRTGERGESAL